MASGSDGATPVAAGSVSTVKLNLVGADARREIPVLLLSDDIGHATALRQVFPKLEHVLFATLLKNVDVCDKLVARHKIVYFDLPSGKRLSASKQEFLAGLLTRVFMLGKGSSIACLCVLPHVRKHALKHFAWFPRHRWARILHAWHPDTVEICSCKALADSHIGLKWAEQGYTHAKFRIFGTGCTLKELTCSSKCTDLFVPAKVVGVLHQALFDRGVIVFGETDPAFSGLTRPRPVQSVVRKMSGRLSRFGDTPELRDPSSLSSVDLEHQAALTHPKREAQELPDSAATVAVESRGDSAAIVELRGNSAVNVTVESRGDSAVTQLLGSVDTDSVVKC